MKTLEDIFNAAQADVDAPYLCEDEGCPQHGKPHVCITKNHALVQALMTAVSCGDIEDQLSDQEIQIIQEHIKSLM